MVKLLLAATAVTTLILNVLLTRYILKDRIITNPSDISTHEVMNFVLTPDAQGETTSETEILETEILS